MELFVHFIYLYKYSICDMIEKIKKEVQQLAEEKTGGTPATKAKNKYKKHHRQSKTMILNEILKIDIADKCWENQH